MKKIKFQSGIKPPIIPLLQSEIELTGFQNGDEFCMESLSGDCSGQVVKDILVVKCVLKG